MVPEYGSDLEELGGEQVKHPSLYHSTFGDGTNEATNFDCYFPLAYPGAAIARWMISRLR